MSGPGKRSSVQAHGSRRGVKNDVKSSVKTSAKKRAPRKTAKPPKPLRRIAPARFIEPSPGLSVRTRLRVSKQDEEVLRDIGTHISGLTGTDLARAVRGDLTSAQRKNLLTPSCSARWAGSIIRHNDALVALTRRCLEAEIADKNAAIAKITERLALPADNGGYVSDFEHYGKTLRLEMLRQRVAECRAMLAPDGHLSIVRGGRKLLRNRQHLEEIGISPSDWREDWTAPREVISANGSHDELAGNLTIRVTPNTDKAKPGSCVILLPTPLRHLSNTPDHDHYRLDAGVTFPHREADWLAQIGSGAINYTIRRLRYGRTTEWRWYLDASWIDAGVATDRRAERKARKEAKTVREAARESAEAAAQETGTVTMEMITATADPDPAVSVSSPDLPEPTSPSPDLSSPPSLVPPVRRSLPLRRFTDPVMSPFAPGSRPVRSIGLDLNADHLAVWILDADGNPVGHPYRIELRLRGLSAAKRDGHLRAAISRVIAIAHAHNVTVIFSEDLGWEDEKSRESFGHNKTFRHTINGFPTTRFRQRLVAMATRAGLTIVAVDPAYTSKWGTSHWAKPTSTKTHPTTGHEAAAIAIGRRGLSLRLRRRSSRICRDRSDPAGKPGKQSADASVMYIGVSGKMRGGPARPSLPNGPGNSYPGRGRPYGPGPVGSVGS